MSFMTDTINKPKHYRSLGAMCDCGQVIECISVTRHLNFNLGNAIKYIWRCDHKENTVEDLKKAVWYLNDEIKRIQKLNPPPTMYKKCKANECGNAIPMQYPRDFCGMCCGEYVAAQKPLFKNWFCGICKETGDERNYCDCHSSKSKKPSDISPNTEGG